MPSQPNDSVGKLVIKQAEPPIEQADALIVADQTSHRQHGWLPRTIVSGGQTGADRAALDWARSHRTRTAAGAQKAVWPLTACCLSSSCAKQNQPTTGRAPG